jgi:RNA polymerase sigma factor (sigma-70 family)
LDKLKIIDANEHFSPDLESQWITQAQQGDQQAFYRLYENYHRRIYALCWRMMADKDSAEDVCQEVFVQLWQKISNFRGESKFSTWLHSVASNIALGHIRKNKTWLQRIFSIEEQVIEDATVEMPECSSLDKKIQKLPERARLVFVLFAIEGYRHEEIAQMLGMAVGTSKAQYHRARGLLRESLSE